MKSKYSIEDRKYLVQTIENLKNEKDYATIFEILIDDDVSSYTVNTNGVFINLSIVKDETLDKIKKYIAKINKKKINEINVDIDIIPNIYNNKNERTYKLNNYEKNILKQKNLKKVLNNENDYQELHLVSKKTKKGNKN